MLNQVSLDLRASFPEAKGFSKDNLYRMGQFYRFYSGQNEIVAQVVPQLQPIENKENTFVAQVVRSSGGNELSPRRESLGDARQTLRRWILAAEMGLLGEYYPMAPVQSHSTMRRKSDESATRKELEAMILNDELDAAANKGWLPTGSN